MKKATVESRTAETILQTPNTIKIADTEYLVPKPTTATIIELSKYIATIPNPNIHDDSNVLFESLAIGSGCEYLGHVLAILILGAKKIQPNQSQYAFRFIPRKTSNNQLETLSVDILNELTPKELFNHTVSLLQDLEVGFFLNTIIFLRDVNLLRQTKY